MTELQTGKKYKIIALHIDDAHYDKRELYEGKEGTYLYGNGFEFADGERRWFADGLQVEEIK